MNNTTIIIVVLVLLVVIAALAIARSRRANDGVDSFRRQIDALSPEARRPVVDQVQNAAGRHGTDDEAEDAVESADDADVDDDDDDDDDEGGARGT